MYYRARELALANNRVYHVAAILYRGKSIIRVGTNTNKTHPNWIRSYNDGSWNAHMHAEMNVLRFAQPGDRIEILRFSKRGNRTMARPCEHCQEALATAGITNIKYTDWDGQWRTL